MSIEFEPTKSFCYKFARYSLLDLIAKEPEALTGQAFKLVDVAKRVTERLLTPEQLATQIPAAQADRIDTIYGAIKFFATLHAKRLQSSPFKWLGDGGMYKLKQADDFEQEMEDAELEADEDDITEDVAPTFDGWIYAFSFPILVKEGQSFPIKIGKTINDVEGRVAHQCKGSASFDNPIILGRWQVKRVSHCEMYRPCATTGYRTASSNHTRILSIIAAMPGTSSWISLGASCPSDCVNGRMGAEQWDLV